MFGNAFGWKISAALVLIMVGGIVLMDFVLNENTPTTKFVRNADVMSPIALPSDPTTIVPMTKSGDAGPLYRQAMEAHQTGRKQEAIDKILQASGNATARIFAPSPKDVVGYDLDREPFKSLIAAGNDTLRAGAVKMSQKNFSDADRHFEAAFTLGHKLYLERLSNWEYREGISLMGGAAAALSRSAELQGNKSRAAQFKKFNEDNLAYYKKSIEPMLRIITSIDFKVIDEHAGDIFEIARKHPERMWRVEAVLKLGRYKYMAGRASDQRGAIRYLKNAADNPALDSAVRIAATAGRDLTIEEYRMLR